MDTNTILLSLILVAITTMGFFMMSSFKALASHQIEMGRWLLNNGKHQILKDDYFDLEARTIQTFVEQLLGKQFNAQCMHSKEEKLYKLWVWKRYDTREMGCMIEGLSPAELVRDFMKMYYSVEYFTDATAFPNGTPK